MTIDAICFDLDDTLYDYGEYARTGLLAAADRLEKQTGEQYHDELLELYFEDDLRTGTFDVLLDRHDLSEMDLEPLVDAYHGATAPLAPYHQTESVLTDLGENYRLGVVTDGRGGRAKLERLGLLEYFDAIVVTPVLGRSKTEPAVFHCVLSGLDVSPERTAYVGDDPRVDFAVPNQLGVETIRLRRGRYTDLEPAEPEAVPDHEIEALDELLALVDSNERDPVAERS